MKKLFDYSEEERQTAREHVADWWAENQKKIRTGDSYASHVTEEKKEENLKRGLATAEKIRSGDLDFEFWCWQRLITHLSGECPALLP